MIGRLYRWLFDAHRHEWETIWSGGIEKDGRWIGHSYTLRCKKCGDITFRKVGL